MPTHRPKLVVIAAVARNGVIGLHGRLPWHLPQDMARFKTLTGGCPVIMGRRTWDSLPPRFRPLPGRVNIVVTRQRGWQASGALAAGSLAAGVALAGEHCAANQRVFVIGGAELYAQALPLADELELTEVLADVSGDAHFPRWRRDEFSELQREHHASAGPDRPAFDFVTYRRKPSQPS
ncbi:MAG: dihydrofolate reductase [Burkholderiaceae bacterium]